MSERDVRIAKGVSKMFYLGGIYRDIVEKREQRTSEIRKTEIELSEINIFYKAPCEKIVGEYGYYYHKQIIQIFKDMQKYGFRDIPSISGRNAVNPETHLEFEFKNKYDLFLQISLFEHTIGVANTIIEDNKNYPPMILELLIIFALTHDFGKCRDIKKIYGNASEKSESHESISAEYFRSLFQGSELEQDTVDFHTKIISSMHKTKISAMNDYQKKLIDADIKTRRREFAMLTAEKR